jgi:dihydrofolate reductase
MIAGRVFIATSLDGFIARRNGDIDWLPGLAADGGDYGYGDFIRGVDGIVMGSGSFRKVLTFPSWPYDKPVVVMSRSLAEADLGPDLAGRVTIWRGEPQPLMVALARRGWTAAYVDGGQVIQSFLRQGLIDEMTISRIPALIGDGLALFGALEGDVRLEHRQTTAYPSGLVQSRYGVVR